MPPTTPDPFDTDPSVRAARAIRGALETAGITLNTGVLLAAGQAAANELGRTLDHGHHWQAWRDAAPAHVFDDDLASLATAARATVRAAAEHGHGLPLLEAVLEQVDQHRADAHLDQVLGEARA